jgi:hypothetical protein
VARDKELAKEMAGSEILMVLALGSDKMSHIEDLMILAKSYAEEP